MFPAAFDYVAPTSLDEVFGLLQKHGDEAKVMAGGQSLIPLLKLRLAHPALIVAGGIRQRGDRRAQPLRDHQHRNAGDLRQGLGGPPLEGGDRIADDPLTLLAEHAAAGIPCVLATVVRCDPPTSAKPGDKAVITADGRLRGWIGGSCSEPVVRREALRALAEGTPRLVKIVPAEEARTSHRPGELTMATTCPSGGALDIFIEPQLPKPLLVVFGESPAAETLAGLVS